MNADEKNAVLDRILGINESRDAIPPEHWDRATRLFVATGLDQPRLPAGRDLWLRAQDARKLTVTGANWRKSRYVTVPVVAAAAMLLAGVWFWQTPRNQKPPVLAVTSNESRAYGRQTTVRIRNAVALETQVRGETLVLQAQQLNARFDFKPEAGMRGLTIETPEARLEVVGTSFTVEASQGYARMYVAEGTVRAIAGGRSDQVTAGQTWQWAAGGARTSAASVEDRARYSGLASIVVPEKPSSAPAQERAKNPASQPMPAKPELPGLMSAPPGEQVAPGQEMREAGSEGTTRAEREERRLDREARRSERQRTGAERRR